MLASIVETRQTTDLKESLTSSLRVRHALT